MELRQFFLKALIVVGIVAGVYGLYQIRSLLFLFFGAVLFASTVRPTIVSLSQRGIPAGLSIVVIYLGFLVGLAAILVILTPPLLSSAQYIFDSQAAIFRALESVMQRIQGLAMGTTGSEPLLSVVEFRSYISDLQAAAQEQSGEILLDTVRIISEALIMFVIAFYWLTQRDRLEELIARMLPLRHRDRFKNVVGEIEVTLGAFVRGQTILCVTVGIFSFVVLTALGVESALVLAIFAAVTEAIPMIGPIIGAVPAILVALLDSPEKAILVTLAFVVIQQIEAQILVPKVMERQVGLNPLLVLLALIAGNLLAGLPGALVAIPIAAALKVIVLEFFVEPTVEARKFPVMEGGAVLLEETGTAEEVVEPPATPAGPPLVGPK